MKTAKFGGTSLADAARFRQVKRIVSADPELRFVVVSAPGKRSAEDKKVTDLLYDCHAAVKTGTDPETAFAPVAVRFRQIAQELRLGIDLEAELRQIEKDLRSGASAAYCASRGEYLSGRMLAALLGWPFLDPAELHFFDADGVPQHKLAEQALMHRLHDMERAVMPGFYGGGAAARISPERCWQAPPGRMPTKTGRTCPASSVPILRSCPAQGRFPPWPMTRYGSLRIWAPTCCTRTR